MAKDKVVEEITKTANKSSNILLQYSPLIVGLFSLIVCYLLFKKIQTLNSYGDSVNKIEKQLVNNIKEQNDINALNSKKINSIMNQINQLGYIVQNSKENNIQIQ